MSALNPDLRLLATSEPALEAAERELLLCALVVRRSSVRTPLWVDAVLTLPMGNFVESEELRRRLLELPERWSLELRLRTVVASRTFGAGFILPRSGRSRHAAIASLARGAPSEVVAADLGRVCLHTWKQRQRQWSPAPERLDRYAHLAQLPVPAGIGPPGRDRWDAYDDGGGAAGIPANPPRRPTPLQGGAEAAVPSAD